MRRTCADLYAVLFDLNRFKEINDTLGHSTGDQVIKTLACKLKDSGLPFKLFARKRR